MSGKILYLSQALPPDTSGSAIIALNLLRQFSRDEMVAAGEKPFGKPAVAWKREWPELLYLQKVWPFTRRFTKSWRRFQFPWVLLCCLWIVWTRGVHQILAVFPDEQFLFVGYLLALFTRRPLYVYFHNTYYENRVGVRRAFAGWLQPRVFRRAKHVFVMSRGMSDYFKKKYPGVRQTPLVHAFNEPIPVCDVLPPVGSPLRLAFCGNVNLSCEDAATRFGQAIAACNDVVVRIYSGTNPDYLRQIGLLPPGVSCEKLSRDEIPSRLSKADILLLPHGFSDPGCAARGISDDFPYEDDRVSNKRPADPGTFSRGKLLDAFPDRTRLRPSGGPAGCRRPPRGNRAAAERRRTAIASGAQRLAGSPVFPRSSRGRRTATTACHQMCSHTRRG